MLLPDPQWFNDDNTTKTRHRYQNQVHSISISFNSLIILPTDFNSMMCLSWKKTRFEIVWSLDPLLKYLKKKKNYKNIRISWKLMLLSKLVLLLNTHFLNWHITNNLDWRALKLHWPHQISQFIFIRDSFHQHTYLNGTSTHVPINSINPIVYHRKIEIFIRRNLIFFLITIVKF